MAAAAFGHAAVAGFGHAAVVGLSLKSPRA
jgi:hypothetical protein